jgi:hypothetical protein
MERSERKRSVQVPVSEKILQKAASRLLPKPAQLVSTEIHYIQRVLGTAATQQEIDENVVAVRKLPWTTIAAGD